MHQKNLCSFSKIFGKWPNTSSYLYYQTTGNLKIIGFATLPLKVITRCIPKIFVPFQKIFGKWPNTSSYLYYQTTGNSEILGSTTQSLKVITRCIQNNFVRFKKSLATRLVILATYTSQTTGNLKIPICCDIIGSATLDNDLSLDVSQKSLFVLKNLWGLGQ